MPRESLWYIEAFDRFYPSGGTYDMTGPFGSKEEAMDYANQHLQIYRSVSILQIFRNQIIPAFCNDDIVDGKIVWKNDVEERMTRRFQ